MPLSWRAQLPTEADLEEVSEVLKEQHTLVQVDFPSRNLPTIASPSQSVDSLADEAALLVFVAVSVKHEATLDSNLIRVGRVKNADVRNEVGDARIGFVGPVDARTNLLDSLFQSGLIVGVPGQLGAFSRELSF